MCVKYALPWAVVDALTEWGIDYAFEPPRAGEPSPPAPLMVGTKVYSAFMPTGSAARCSRRGAFLLEAWARFSCARTRRLPRNDIRLLRSGRQGVRESVFLRARSRLIWSRQRLGFPKVSGST
jgi:hypothetical protein